MKNITGIISILGSIILNGCYSPINTESKVMRKQIVSENGVYRNYLDENIHYTKKALRVFTGTLFSKRKVESSEYDPDKKIEEWWTQSKPPEKSSSPRISWIGHATVLIQIANLNILTDPVYAEDLGFKYTYSRVQSPGVAFKDLPHIDYILLSHNHSDHLDVKTIKDLVRKQKKSAPIVFVPKGVKKYMIKKCGYEQYREKVKEFLWYKEVKINSSSLTFTFLPAYHSSGRNPLHLLPAEKTIFTDPNRSAWGSWLIEQDNYKIYFAGDTGYQTHFKDINKYLLNRFKTAEIDIALLPIAPIEPSDLMKEMKHIGPKKALEAFKELKADVFIPIHWGTFQLAQDTFMGAINLLKKQAAEDGNFEIVDKLKKPGKNQKGPYIKLFAIGESQVY